MITMNAEFSITLEVETLRDLNISDSFYNGYDCNIYIKKHIDYLNFNYQLLDKFYNINIFFDLFDKDDIDEILFCRDMVERGIGVYYKADSVWVKIEMNIRYRKLLNSIVIKMDESLITIDTPFSISLFYKLLNGTKCICLDEEEQKNAKLFEKLGLLETIGENVYIPAFRVRSSKFSDWE